MYNKISNYIELKKELPYNGHAYVTDPYTLLTQGKQTHGIDILESTIKTKSTSENFTFTTLTAKSNGWQDKQETPRIELC